MSVSGASSRNIYLRPWGPAAAVTLVAAAALIFDALTPRVVSLSFFYVALVLTGYWLPQPKAALALALLATPLIIIGNWIALLGSSPVWVSWMNRGLSIGVVWLTAVFVWRIRVLEGKLQRQIDIASSQSREITWLAGEAEHRAKNLLANVKAMVHLSQADTPDGLKKAIEGRIGALADVHSLFMQSRWEGAELNKLVRQELSPYCHEGEERVRIGGPIVMLKPNVAQTIAVTLHELATNAAKYGALSVAKGEIRTEWSRAADGSLVLRWTEAGGPAVSPPSHGGFGTHVMQAMIQGHGGDMRLDWRDEGLVCEVTLPNDAPAGG
jgi:two-component sensor histidine kinase